MMLSNDRYLSDYQNDEFLHTHVRRLMQSYQHWLQQPLVEPSAGADEVTAIMHCQYAIASHQMPEIADANSEARFNFANLAALSLFKMRPEQIMGLPSRYSAEPMLQEDRAQFLQRVEQHGYVQDYAGIRIAHDGSRFEIQGATVWNVFDPQQPELGLLGQAVIIRSVRHL